MLPKDADREEVLEALEEEGGLSPGVSARVHRETGVPEADVYGVATFYHLLSELAVDRIVLLSTHIVEDVAVLCPRFAVIREGRLLALTTPGEARAAIDGHMFEGTVAPSDLTRLREDRMVTQALLVEGRNRARIFEPSGTPPEGFAPAPVTLEDAYLVLMKLGTLPEVAAGASGGAR